ncbi:MAG TPA: hypothetical protein VLL54_13345 [Pyrinomonadaceae bacterium]|nr:hypothetical protein [Pyrinomonadaceae bacterium]
MTASTIANWVVVAANPNPLTQRKSTKAIANLRVMGHQEFRRRQTFELTRQREFNGKHRRTNYDANMLPPLVANDLFDGAATQARSSMTYDRV